MWGVLTLPFLRETKLPREPELSCELKSELSCVMRCEFLFVSLLTCAEYNTVESGVNSDWAFVSNVLTSRLLKA